jgi:uncharacterized membrane-anchored protein
MTRRAGVIAVVLAVVCLDAAAKPAKKPAQPPPPPPPAEEPAPPADDAERPLTPDEIEASLPPHINGPKLVDLGHDIEIDLPAGMLLLERTEAQAMLREGGGSAENVLAVVAKLDADWMIVVEYADIGYVTDTDADQLDANELFQQYVEGTKEQNERRRALGVPELYLDGWSEMPAYKKQVHHLVWGLKGHTDEGPVINFFTRILGRNGFLSVNLIDAPDRIEASKAETAPVLAATRFKQGARYEDHQEGDKSSGIGLRALVLGGTGVAVVKAAKAGFLIKLLLVFKKGFILVIVAIGGLFKWLLGRKNKDSDLDVPPPPPETTDSQV